MPRTGGLTMRWVGHQRITCNCLQCGNPFQIPPARAKTARFCSLSCHGIYQRSAKRRHIKCERCGVVFETRQDHGAWPRFCSRKCFRDGAMETKECPSCGCKFEARRKTDANSIDGRSVYCSRKCRNEGLTRGEDATCVNCGGAFYRVPSKANNLCCSWKCRTEFYVETASPGWRGGKYVSIAGDRRVRIDRSKRGGSAYMGEHRIVVARQIGRALNRWEPVLHINANKLDNRPGNLFVCGSLSEMGRRLQGSLPFPKASNLGKFR